MFFSRVRLNPTRRGTMKFLASPQAMHAVVMGSCGPEVSGSDTGRVLWRVDQPERHTIELYVVSPARPDFTGLIEQAGWPTTETWDTTSYDPFLGRIRNGQQWRFRLTANPVRSVSGGQGTGRGKVVPHRTRRFQEEWLLERAKGWGFEIPDASDSEASAVTLVERDQRTFGRRDPHANPPRRHSVDITRATYAGVLDVVDEESLRRSLTHGIGRAKAYGCGLLILAPVR
jgi:CRISPR system Cascade subunit CasE